MYENQTRARAHTHTHTHTHRLYDKNRSQNDGMLGERLHDWAMNVLLKVAEMASVYVLPFGLLNSNFTT